VAGVGRWRGVKRKMMMMMMMMMMMNEQFSITKCYRIMFTGSGVATIEALRLAPPLECLKDLLGCFIPLTSELANV
jgi:hypothetical protein